MTLLKILTLYVVAIIHVMSFDFTKSSYSTVVCSGPLMPVCVQEVSITYSVKQEVFALANKY